MEVFALSDTHDRSKVGVGEYQEASLDPAVLAAIYFTAFRIRAFELRARQAVQDKEIRIPVYLGVGHEMVAATLAHIIPKPAGIFAQHRGHSYYLAFGGSMRALADELRGRDTGCNGGLGGSASISDRNIGMFGHSGLMGDQVPLAVGYALATQRSVLTVVGDASGEEDYVLGALGYAATKRVPLLCVCEDNDLSILTPVNVRRSWRLSEVASALGLAAVDVTDDPALIASVLGCELAEWPAFINVHVARHVWHAGAGSDGAPSWDRLAMVRAHLITLGCEDLSESEAQISEEVDASWV